jgi:hypothetical protein
MQQGYHWYGVAVYPFELPQPILSDCCALIQYYFTPDVGFV